ncbi:MAG: MFS transporter [Pyrinomonadaceae bacterium]
MEGNNPGSNSYGWVIVAVATLTLVISNGLSIGGLPPFYKPIREEFVALGMVDASRAESFIATGANVTFLMSGVFSLIGGWLITRFWLKPIMIAGCAMLGAGLVLHSQAASENAVYLSRFLMGASLGFVGVTPCVILVSNWFQTGRGTALGIALTGTSLGGSLVSLVAGPLIASYGWRTSLLALTSVVWFVLLPAIIFFVKEVPSKRGQPCPPATEGTLPNAGNIREEGNKTLSESVDGITLRQALSTPLFWAFAAAAALVFYPIFVILQQFILYVQTPKIGISAQTAAFGQSALFAISIGGKFLAGYLSDKFGAVRIMVFFAALMFASSLILLDLTAANALFFLLPFAIGYGGTWVMLQRLAADLFGRREIGKILGLITLIEVSGAAIGGRITGYLADQAGGDYTFAFYGVTIAAGFALLAAIAVFALVRNQNNNEEHA